MSTSPTRSVKTADFGSLRTTIESTIIKCKTPDSFVNRLDIQSNLWTAGGWDVPFISGFRLYCSDNSPPQPLNWSPKPVNGSVITSVDGAVVNEGINDLIVSHGKYINLVGYGTGTMIGNLKELKVWQQAAQRDYSECLLSGIECTHASWIDGCRMHFSCASGSKPADAAGGSDATPCTSGGFAIGTFAGGIGAGLVVAAALLALLVFVRGRKMAVQAKATQMEVQQVTNQQAMQVVTADPYASVFNNNSNNGTGDWQEAPRS